MSKDSNTRGVGTAVASPKTGSGIQKIQAKTAAPAARGAIQQAITDSQARSQVSITTRFIRSVFPGLALAALLSLATTAQAQVPRPGPDSPWLIAPAFFPRGALINFAEGDPHRAMPIRVELALPNGYRMPAHTHAQTIRVEILEGQLAVGSGDRLDPKRTRVLNPGDTLTVAGGSSHYFIAQGEETVVSITTVGPLLFTYVEPELDPSAKKPFGGSR